MQTRLLVTGVAIFAALAGFLTAHLWRAAADPQPDTTAWVYTQPRDPGDFRLLMHSGDPFTPESITGHWSLWFFGFTHCPDICPMTLATLDAVDRLLADAGRTRPTVLMVSVDPSRDTPESLASYITWFNPAFIGVTGEASEILDLTARLGIAVAYRAGDTDEDYTVDHGAALLLSDPRGHIRAVFQPPHEPDTLAQDLAALIPWLEKGT